MPSFEGLSYIILGEKYLYMVPPARIELAIDPYHGPVIPFN